MPEPALILDLDGTLLHPSPVADAVRVPGRTRASWLAGATLRALARCARTHRLVLATARSRAACREVLAALDHAGATPYGLVLEDGGCFGPPGGLRPFEPGRRWAALRRHLDAHLAPHLDAHLTPHLDPGPPRTSAAAGAPPPPGWQDDFEHCLVWHAGTPGRARRLRPVWATHALQHTPDLRVHLEGSKLYLCGRQAHKASALEALLGADLADASGIGDGENDRCWLPRVRRALTLGDAPPAIRQLVQAAGGVVVAVGGHAGIVAALEVVANGV